MSYELVKLNTARNALRFVIQNYGIQEIYLPYYICPSLRVAVAKENCKIFYYHIDKNFNPLCEFPSDAYIVYPNYFGVCSSIVDKLVHKYKNLIVDNAHSFFSKPKGVASFSSLRKFFPILRNGSFLYLLHKNEMSFDVDDYSYQSKLLSDKEFILNENFLDKQEIKHISYTTMHAFNSLDLDIEKKKRLMLFKFLSELFAYNIDLKTSDCPMAFPYFAKNQESAFNISKKLEKIGFRVYRYWNKLPNSYPESIFYSNLLVISLNVEDELSLDINPEYMSFE